MNDVNKRVITLVGKILRPVKDQINLDSAVNVTENWDSLAQLNVLAALEQEFSIEIDPHSAVDLNSVRDICNYLAKQETA